MKGAVVELSNVTVKRDGRILLDSVTWTILQGQHWALLGANGSGKTLTLKMLLGHLWPSEGAVAVLGHAFGSYDLRKLRRHIGWVNFDIQYQFMIRRESVADVVVSGQFGTIGIFDQPVTDEHRLTAKAMLERVQIGALIERRFDTLSFGEQKRVLIARALMTEPRLLILDEPCTGLDPAARERFLHSVADLAAAGGHTILFVTHHTEELLPFLSHTLLLKEGRVLAQGMTPEVITSENLSKTFSVPLRMQTVEGRYWTQPC
ncbi:MAG: ABC transporter ATP-binding protein [Bdellovibrionales bacterium]|nr:ABC transporter ATP-binding protein [Bdellovibrionales bacterium]